ncbi:MAG: type 1 glutamine amidotransferase [Proteobacteria bacterium]|nr:type 1 glutamine amidotransferase [Pseudomonadota bacterium]
MKALIIAEDGFEDSELLYPLYRLQEEGYAVDLASSRSGPVAGKVGYTVHANVTYDVCRADDYTCLVLPGGKSPERARLIPRVLELARGFVQAGKAVGAICHGPQILLSAGLVKGRRMTCYAGIRDDLKAACAEYADEPCVADGRVVTSRTPEDLPWFMESLLREARHAKG